MSERGGQGSHGPPMLEEGGLSIICTPPPQKNLGGLCPLGLVFFTLENVMCLFESAIPGGKKHNIDHILIIVMGIGPNSV